MNRHIRRQIAEIDALIDLMKGSPEEIEAFKKMIHAEIQKKMAELGIKDEPPKKLFYVA